MTPTTQVQSANYHPWKPDRSPFYLAVNLSLLLWTANSGTGTQTTVILEALTPEDPKSVIGPLEANRVPMKGLESVPPCL